MNTLSYKLNQLEAVMTVYFPTFKIQVMPDLNGYTYWRLADRCEFDDAPKRRYNINSTYYRCLANRG